MNRGGQIYNILLKYISESEDLKQSNSKLKGFIQESVVRYLIYDPW